MMREPAQICLAKDLRLGKILLDACLYATVGKSYLMRESGESRRNHQRKKMSHDDTQ